MLLSLLIACLPDPSLEAAVADPTTAARGGPCRGVRPCPLVAQINADVVLGELPLDVTFDAIGSLPGAKGVTFEWDFGDGATAQTRKTAAHTYVSAGSFIARLTLTDAQGAVAVDEIQIDVAEAPAVFPPSCPAGSPAISTGTVDDGALNELSGLAASPTDPEVFWTHEDGGNQSLLIAIDASGATLAEHDLPEDFPDFEDLAAALDPATGEPLVFLGDIGDNGYSRGEVAVWVGDEPDPHVDGPFAPFRMALTYPDGPRNAETLLVDPLTLDLFIVTKETSSTPTVYVKRAPHAAGGPFALESLGTGDLLPYTATGGDISADGAWIVIRDYTSTAWLYPRDPAVPLEEAFRTTSCPIAIHSEQQGEAIAFTQDGSALVTVSEGTYEPIYWIGL